VPPVKHPPTNRLLSALSAKDRRRMVDGCTQVELVFADIISETGDRIEHVYFPLDGFISLVAPIDGHAGLEVGMVGNEGMLGISLMLGVDISPLHTLVQGPGRALRMDAALFRRELEDCAPLQKRLKLYLHVLTSQLAQTAACTRFHMIEARLARWLLMSQDRAHADVFRLTHEFLGYMLGVRRVGVTKAATSLQELDLISYSRGSITILHRKGLEKVSCSCYVADNRVYGAVLG
jgi:CRP-like cAMP-binding protein